MRGYRTRSIYKIRNNRPIFFLFKRSSCDTLRFPVGFFPGFFADFFVSDDLPIFVFFYLNQYTRAVNLHNNKFMTRYQIRNHSQCFSRDFLQSMHFSCCVAQSPVLATPVVRKGNSAVWFRFSKDSFHIAEVSRVAAIALICCWEKFKVLFEGRQQVCLQVCVMASLFLYKEMSVEIRVSRFTVALKSIISSQTNGFHLYKMLN